LPYPIPGLGGCRTIDDNREGFSGIRHKIGIGKACCKRTRYCRRAIEQAAITSNDPCTIVVEGDRGSDFVPGDRSVRLIAQLPDRELVHAIVLHSRRAFHIEPAIGWSAKLEPIYSRPGLWRHTPPEGSHKISKVSFFSFTSVRRLCRTSPSSLSLRASYPGHASPFRFTWLRHA
jgi:hypothetical protein